MARTRLVELDKYRFVYEQMIHLSDVNIAGHSGSVEITSLMQEGRYRMLKSMGCSDLNLGDGSTGSIMADMVINFKGEIFLDDRISISMDISEMEENGYRVFYRFIKNGKTAALAETGFVTFSFKEKKKVKVPLLFIERLNSITDTVIC